MKGLATGTALDRRPVPATGSIHQKRFHRHFLQGLLSPPPSRALKAALKYRQE
ncbi:MAG: hypothetical protein KME26_08010 [Oscillatoria princeps RMCB-10]|nr:hypothetical protein [Oscillatoria princeps RMCB-10]